MTLRFGFRITFGFGLKKESVNNYFDMGFRSRSGSMPWFIEQNQKQARTGCGAGLNRIWARSDPERAYKLNRDRMLCEKDSFSWWLHVYLFLFFFKQFSHACRLIFFTNGCFLLLRLFRTSRVFLLFCFAGSRTVDFHFSSSDWTN